MAKWIIGIIIVALLGGALWYSGVLGNLSMTPTPTATSTSATTTQQAAVPQPENGMSATTDASDSALVQDTTAIDAQFKSLSSDSASVDGSASDKQVTQSY
jgi:hypothetical protein